MRALTAGEIRGTWATVLTPFRDDDGLDLGRLEQELDVLLDARPQGVYTHGTAGEFFNQTEGEWDLVVAAVAERCTAAAVPFQLGASHPSPVIAVDRVRRARRWEPSAIQVVLPSWLPLNRSEIRDCLRMYAAAAEGIGLVLYNSPHSKNALGASSLAALCDDLPELVGVKTSDGDAAWYLAMRPVMERVSVFVPGHHLATGLSSGASGAYSNIACLSPAGAVEWGEKSIADPAWGIEVERDVTLFMAEGVGPLRDRGYSALTIDKALATAGGFFGEIGRVRSPYSTATSDEIARLRSAAYRLLPEFLHPRAA